MIEPLLHARGYADGDFLIKRVSPAEIPLYLSAADAAVSFIKPCYSKQASSPTKNAEYLACGLPIIANDGIGDTTEFTETDETGVVISNFTSETYLDALSKLDELMKNKNLLAERCKASADKRFDLVDVGGVRYRSIYQKILTRKSAAE
jgi:glycosyltransferase involved in cell wall biosynthesis